MSMTIEKLGKYYLVTEEPTFRMIYDTDDLIKFLTGNWHVGDAMAEAIEKAWSDGYDHAILKSEIELELHNDQI